MNSTRAIYFNIITCFFIICITNAAQHAKWDTFNNKQDDSISIGLVVPSFLLSQIT